MRHKVFGKQLSRSKNERRRLLQNLARALITHERITTTLTKAKAVQPLVEKMITKAKEGSEQKKREAFAVLGDRETVAVLWKRANQQLKDVHSGYTRIIKYAPRRGDGTTMVVLSFVKYAEVDTSVEHNTKEEKKASKEVTKKPEVKKETKKKVSKKKI